jgi:glycosyltransferase involved in cell wall biosynthesis
MEEVCEDSALYFEKNNIESLKKALQTLFQNQELKNDLIKKGLERALFFRKEKNIPKLIELYNKLVSQQRLN